MKYRICVFTGTRAEYGLLRPLIQEIKSDKDLELKLIASCMHLSPEFGLTYKEIEKDKIEINEKIEILMSSATSIGTIKSIGVGLISFPEILSNLKPDLSIILGDRFEALAFAISCYFLKIPIAHLYGGEVTYGSFDENIRHSITKLSYLHFTSTEEYRKRVIQLGEDPKRVFNVGSLSIDNIKKLIFLNRKELEEKLSIKFKKINFLITYHPEMSEENTEKGIENLLKSLEDFYNSEKDSLFIFTKSNADPYNNIINLKIEEFTKKYPSNSVLFDSLGEVLYLSTMKEVNAIIGNSSSGIIYSSSFKIPVVNIGDRQKGRIKPQNVIDSSINYSDIKKAIKKSLSHEFISTIRFTKNPYGVGNSAEKIKNIIKKFLPIKNPVKIFFDINHDK
ncbi:MAG: UDP-N-acetylglucosamine 2-epimerase [Candidatus Calescibacterium sp.]|nr:UDP-N-acetylglucosamine 2-epimerase [Candidatus Calescibacterium sp.]MDW8132996.1 UDP-N-acetylglucosamine 2-epimerase [Candidatus Calescibacterium sp.]